MYQFVSPCSLTHCPMKHIQHCKQWNITNNDLIQILNELMFNTDRSDIQLFFFPPPIVGKIERAKQILPNNWDSHKVQILPVCLLFVDETHVLTVHVKKLPTLNEDQSNWRQVKSFIACTNTTIKRTQKSPKYSKVIGYIVGLLHRNNERQYCKLQYDL